MSLSIRPGLSDDHIYDFCKRASRLSLSQIIDQVAVNEELTQSRHRQFTVAISFYPRREYEAEYNVGPKEILRAFASRFPLALKKEMAMELKKLQADLKTHLSNLGKGRAETRPGNEGRNEDEDGDANGRDDESEHGDGDASANKKVQQQKQMTSYDDDDEDKGPRGEYDDEGLEAEFAKNKDVVDEDNSSLSDEENSTPPPQAKSFKEVLSEVTNLFLKNLPSASSFLADEQQARFELEVRSRDRSSFFAMFI